MGDIPMPPLSDSPIEASTSSRSWAKYPAPPQYTGKTDPEAFIFKISNYLVKETDEAEKLRLAVGYLAEGPALNLYLAHKPTTTADLYDALRRRFGDVRKSDKAVDLFRKAQQTSSVAGYNDYFLRICEDLPSGIYTDRIKLDAYLSGLKNTVRSFVEVAHRPTTLREAMDCALLKDAYTPAPTQQHRTGPGYKPAPKQHYNNHYRQDGPTPMEIGAMPRTTTTYGKKRGTYSDAAQRQQPQPQQPQQQAPSWPPPYRPGKPCPACHKFGHWMVNCPLVTNAAAN
jgi:hypothetical protein